MRKTMGALLMLLMSSAFKGQINPSGHMELTKLRMALLYLRFIKTSRLLFLSLLSMGMCLVFLLAGLILFHVSLFLYAPWSIPTKMFVGLGFSFFYLLVTLIVFSQIFASEKWLEIFHAHTIIDHLNKEAVPKANHKPMEQRSS